MIVAYGECKGNSKNSRRFFDGPAPGFARCGRTGGRIRAARTWAGPAIGETSPSSCDFKLCLNRRYRLHVGQRPMTIIGLPLPRESVHPLTATAAIAIEQGGVAAAVSWPSSAQAEEKRSSSYEVTYLHGQRGPGDPACAEPVAESTMFIPYRT